MITKEQARLKIHNTAVEEGRKFSNSHSHTIQEEIAYGDGFEEGYVLGCADSNEEFNKVIDRTITWLKENSDNHIWYDEIDHECGLNELLYDELRKVMEGKNEFV